MSRHMNDSTLPPSSTSVSVSLSKTNGGGRAAGRANVQQRRAKVGVKKGFGLHDWMLLKKSARDLAQRKGRPLRTISRDEIKQHASIHDCWISLHGNVYNLTPYLHYHPGGVDIFKPCLGRDATALFEKYHRWVNIDNLIGPLLLGYLEEEEAKHVSDESPVIIPPSVMGSSNATHTTPNATRTEFAVPAPRPPKTVPSLLSPSGGDDKDGDDDEEDVDPWNKNNA